MWTFSTSSGMATTVVDFTTEFAPLVIGLVGLVLLSAGMIAVIAIRHSLSQQVESTPQVSPAVPNHQEAA